MLYTAAAAASLPPSLLPRPSLVISLSHSTDSHTLLLLTQMAIPEIVKGLNAMLLAHPCHTQVWLSAVKWSLKGNLVVIAGPDTTLVQLEGASGAISSHLSSQLAFPAHITSHINTKWSKVLVNGVPTGVTPNRAALTPQECHQALISNNPSYQLL